MKVYKRFPVTDPIALEGIEGVRVRFKYPTEGQLRMIADAGSELGTAMAICRYCVESVEGLEAEDGPVVVEHDTTPIGKSLKSAFVELLANNRLAFPIAVAYQKHGATEVDAKKSAS